MDSNLNTDEKEKSLKDMMLLAPEGNIDPFLMDKIKLWDDEPTALQILEVLDNAVYAASASDMVIHILQMMFEIRTEEERIAAFQYADENWRKRLIK